MICCHLPISGEREEGPGEVLLRGDSAAWRRLQAVRQLAARQEQHLQEEEGRDELYKNRASRKIDS